mgnify:CR=1 FL=1
MNSNYVKKYYDLISKEYRGLLDEAFFRLSYAHFFILDKMLLEKDYRCEYVYKNQIFQNLISKYSLENSSIFSEFKVGGSIADLFFLISYF